MMQKILLKIQQKLSLGDAIISCQPLLGGALNKMWHFTTDTGHFVLKEMNPAVVRESSFPESYEVSELIADLFHQQGIPAVCGLKANDHYVSQIEGRWFIVYPFIQGKVQSTLAFSAKQLGMIGDIFSSMHNMHLKIPGVDAPHYHIFTDKHWVHLIEAARLDVLVDLKSDILRWNKLYQDAIDHLNQHLVITHRDLHPKNVLWDDMGSPFVVDWEAAGLMNPLLEVIGYGLEWGGIVYGSFIQQNTEILLNQYTKLCTFDICQSDIQPAFYGWLGHCVLGWTEFNLRRMLGESSHCPEEIKMGEHILSTGMQSCLRFIVNHEQELVNMLKKITLL